MQATDADSARKFVAPMLRFVREELSRGNNVLIHCRAGAHRAGTTAIVCLMKLCGMSVDQAVATAKSRRRCIDPIGGLDRLLAFVEEGMLIDRDEAQQSLGAASEAMPIDAAVNLESGEPSEGDLFDAVFTLEDQAVSCGYTEGFSEGREQGVEPCGIAATALLLILLLVWSD